jgi:hypothetical protein
VSILTIIAIIVINFSSARDRFCPKQASVNTAPAMATRRSSSTPPPLPLDVEDGIGRFVHFMGDTLGGRKESRATNRGKCRLPAQSKYRKYFTFAICSGGSGRGI